MKNLAVTLLTTALLAGSALAETIVQGTTAPNRRHEMPLPQMGTVKKVHVVEGQQVKVNDVLIEQDREVEEARLKALEIRADVALAVKGREVDFELRRVIYERVRAIFDQGGGNQSEVQEREAEMKLAAVAIDRERHEGSVAEAEAAAQRARIRQMTLRSPVEGFVERIDAAEGGVTDPQRPSIVIVRLNPLDVEIKSLTPDQVSSLRLGQTVQVRYPGEQDWAEATVKFIAPVVDARSGTQVIKLSLPNPELRYAGLRVEVRLPSRASAEAGNGSGVAGTR